MKNETQGKGLNAASKRIFTSAIYAALIFALLACVGVSYAWYSSVVTRLHADMATVSSAGLGEAPGYELYKYDLESNKGVSVSPELARMNLYDKVYPAKNEHAKIILRAALSDSWETLIDNNGSVRLALNCAYPGKNRDIGDVGLNGQGAGDGIIDYLSNVVNVKAAYIPDIADKASSGDYDSSIYASADDYIYKAAVAFFANVTDELSFVSNSSVEGINNEYPPVYKITDYTSRGAFAGRLEKQNSSSTDEHGVLTSYTYRYAYLISDGSGHYMYLHDRQILNGSVNTANMNNAVMQSYGFSVVRDAGSYDYSFSNNGLGLYAAPYGSTANLLANESSSYFTVGDGLTLSKLVTTSSGSERYYINFSNNKWTLSTSPQFLTVTQVESCTKREYRQASSSAGEKNINMSVMLNESTKSADGYYYVYIQFDYDKELIDAYMRANSISFIVGNSDDGSPFADIFDISVIDASAP